MDMILKGKYIITMDPKRTVIENGYVAVEGQRIAAIGVQAQGMPQARETIEVENGLVMPGMIDGHFHTTQYFLRSKVQFLAREGRLRLPVWKKFFIPFEYSLSQDEAYFSALGAYINLIKNGTTCFAEAGGVQPSAMARALQETGLRGILAISTMDQGSVPEQALFSTSEALEKNAKLVTDYSGAAQGRIGAWLALRQTTICSDELIVGMAKLAQEMDTRVHIHLSEGSYEIEYCLERAGVRPVEYLKKLGLLSERVHAAHAAMLTDDEIELLQQHDVSCVHCPSSNFTLFEKPKVPQMRRAGIRMCLGTDGPSHGSVDLLKEAKISYVAQISHFGAAYGDRHVVSDEDMVAMATIDGARALGMEREIGSIEVGKKADMIVFSLNTNAWPCYDPYYAIARCLCGSDVDISIIDGEVVMQNREIKTVSEREIWRTLEPLAMTLAERVIPKSWA